MLSISNLKELSFLVYGLGITGQSVVKFFKKNKIINFTVWDDKEKKLFQNNRATNLNEVLNKVDYIILSPGISDVKKKGLNKFNSKIITDIDLFFLTNKNFKSVVVTGTNGKSTTCKLISHLLRKNNFKVALGGNIGTPILELKVKKNSYVIIFRHQKKKQFAILNNKLIKFFKKKKFISQLVIPSKKKYKKIKHKIKNHYLRLNINDENMSFVFAFSKLLKIREAEFVRTINSFVGLPHRYEIFLKKKNVIFINDSKATSFESSKFALSNSKNVYWILGGLPKKNDKIILSGLKKNIVKGYLIGKIK